MEYLIDLHMHSLYSDDGEFSPEELVQKCKKQNIGVMSITDHNCVRANKAGQKAAQEAGIRYIPGIEIDCTFQEVDLHILGYGMDYENPYFEFIESNISSQSFAGSYQMLELTQKLGFDICEKDLEPFIQNMYWKDRWTGEMFAEVLLNKPEYKNHPLLLPYRLGGARSDNPYVNFYWDYYSQGKPCYFKMQYPLLEEIIEMLHKNGGQVVLAHPAVNLKNHSELLEQIVAAGMDGVEAFSSYHSPSQRDYYYNEAKKHCLFVTCGSDYHGKIKPRIELGKHGCYKKEIGKLPI